MDLKQASKKFAGLFGEDDFRIFFAPGRINLIGEHTDYNGGYVLPAAITEGTYAFAKKRLDKKVRLYSANFEDTGIIEFDLQHLNYDKKHYWANYPKGMIRYLKDRGHLIKNGVDVLFWGNIPNGAGLSSSASIELATGVMLENLFDLKIGRLELVKIGQQVENEFIGVNSGIMDQFAVGMGKENAGILLDCDTLEFEYIPIQLNNCSILLMNTNKRRELADSKYNERRNECDLAVRQLQQNLDITALGEVSPEQFEENETFINDKTLRKRAKHVIQEIDRVKKAAQALKSGELRTFGKLMDASHNSLRDDYEVTGRELDTLVEAAWKQAGVHGARMTGAGFGGCAIALVEKEHLQTAAESIGIIYREKIGYDASFYEVRIGDGAKEISKEVIK